MDNLLTIPLRSLFGSRTKELTRAKRAERIACLRQALIERWGETRYYRPRLRFEEPPPLIVVADPIARKRRREMIAQQRRVRANKRQWLFKRQMGRCYICRDVFCDERRATEDHVFPRSKGGGRARNILLACEPCNNAKGDRQPKPSEIATLASIYAEDEPETLAA